MKNNLATFLNLQTLYWTAVEAWCKAGFDVWRKANEEYWKVLHPTAAARIVMKSSLAKRRPRTWTTSTGGAVTTLM